MSNTQKQGPAARALTRASVIVAQAEFFDFVEVDFNLATARIGKHDFHRVEVQIRAEQIPRSELKARDDYDHQAGRQRAQGERLVEVRLATGTIDVTLLSLFDQ